MHPAISVIFFTVTSGAGFGLIAMIGAGMPLPNGLAAAFFIPALAGLLAVAGLISSTFHLGHPERAWRAFSQWRSSWLSREGVLSVITLILFGLYTLAWMISGERILWLGLLIAIGSALTVYMTAMIYAQMKTVPHWHTGLTPLCYLLFSLTCGYLLAAGLNGFASGASSPAGLAVVAIAIAWACKYAWWKQAETTSLEAAGSTMESATGLGSIGKVRLLERPHTGENYLTHEMIHVVGRKHAAKLRIIALALGAALPLLIALGVWAFAASTLWLVLAFIVLMAGLFVERWLFFAEAEHAVSLYYGGREA
ncbi:MAG: dimethyl sulfoxide reductase anchor subunit [Hyphomicrobiales bacterium]|nr:dimethyl sulfoxide reductase anchor subunit [Hyphomicrobiales bacterium]MCP4997681.1 dimethyl sulfoxide reductase anchor subunit [Hyphomicrobiales bacterium]